MTITFPKLEKWQKDVFSYLKLGGKDWYVIKSIRQCGKSVLAEILLIYSAFKTPCSVSLSVSPVVSQSRKMYEDILRIASKLVYKSNGSTYASTYQGYSSDLYSDFTFSFPNLRSKARTISLDGPEYLVQVRFGQPSPFKKQQNNMDPTNRRPMVTL
jgi:hypothetical protein